jgi:hypothetical protein
VISGGDIVSLIHTETGGFLSCDGTDYTKDGQAEVFVR